MPRVSVILPTYNDLDYLRGAIAAALTQTYENFELIIVNDGSTDGSKEYLDTLGDPKIRILHKENGGCFDALNHGIDHATGELISWISSDNLNPDYFLDALVAAIDSKPSAKFAYASYYNINANGEITSVNYNNLQFPHELITATHRGNAAFIYYKECHNKVGPYIDSYSCDTDMWVKLSSCYQSIYILEPLYFYRMHDKRATQKLDQKYYFQTTEKIWQGYLELHGTEQLISSLYASISEREDALGYHFAINDLASRFMKSNHLNIAMKLWKTNISRCAPQVLKLIVFNLAQIAAANQPHKEKIFSLFKLSVRANENIPAKKREQYIKRLSDLAKDASEDGPSCYLTDSDRLRRYKVRQVNCFSYLAWKSNACQSATPVMANAQI